MKLPNKESDPVITAHLVKYANLFPCKLRRGEALGKYHKRSRRDRNLMTPESTVNYLRPNALHDVRGASCYEFKVR